MNKKIAASFALLSLFALSNAPVFAQAAYQSQGQTGDFGRSSFTTNNARLANSRRTSNQRGPRLPMTGLGGTAPIFGPTGRNGLPVTSLDSFVLNAGGHAEHIYGDEGADGIPPYFEFTKAHRINIGITGQRDQGITTGHGSYMPDAWGGDEFVDGPEWSMSGHNGGNGQHWVQGSYLGANPGTPNTGDPGQNPLNNVGNPGGADPSNPNLNRPDNDNLVFPDGSNGQYLSPVGNGGANPNGWADSGF